jgi:hypothetical protein
VRRARREDEQVSDDRRDKGDVLRMPPHHPLGQRDHVVEPAGSLHRGQGRDDRDDHSDDDSGRTTGRQPEDEHEHEEPDARDGAKPDAAHARTDDDAGEQHEEFNPKHRRPAPV